MPKGAGRLSIISKKTTEVVCPGIIYPSTVVTIGSTSYAVTQNLVNSSCIITKAK